MKHSKHTFKIGRTSSHKRCLIANMLKDLIVHGRVQTTVAKAKELRRHADKMITIAKKDTLASKRDAIAKLMIRFNRLTPKQRRLVKEGDLSSYNNDRKVVDKLFQMKEKFINRNGGYTRIIKKENRVGDAAPLCILEYLEE
jgi:large subunit ribosomal protein L17